MQQHLKSDGEKTISLYEWINNKTKWSSLNKIGNSKLSQSTILIPFIPYIIDILNANLPSGVNVSGATLNLKLIYFGLFFFASGSVVYVLFCPPTIRRYPEVVDYLDQQLKYVKKQRKLGLEEYAATKKWIGTELNMDAEDLLIATHRGLNISYPFIRLTCSVMYSCGILLCTVPTLSRFGVMVWNTIQNA